MDCPLISICIPTRNRWYSLQYTLKSIIEQDEFQSGEVEIVISDNASTDETEEEVKKLQKKYNNIKYSRNKENIGGDANIKKSFSLGKGKYVRVVGSDDLMSNDCLNKNIGIIKQFNPDIIKNSNGTNPINYKVLKNEKYYNKEFQIQLFNNQSQYFNYLGNQFMHDKTSFIILECQLTRISSTCIKRDFLNKSIKDVSNELILERDYSFIHTIFSHYNEGSIIVIPDYLLSANRNLNKTLEKNSKEIGTHSIKYGIKYIKDSQYFHNLFQKKYNLNNNYIKLKRKSFSFRVFSMLLGFPVIQFFIQFFPKKKLLSIFGKLF